MNTPLPTRYYHPKESPTRYPLELTNDLHICLWDEKGMYKWTIALWNMTEKGFELRFVGPRPLDGRVDWEHFRELIVQGQRMADARGETDQLALYA
jgi:hypothetical protein